MSPLRLPYVYLSRGRHLRPRGAVLVLSFIQQPWLLELLRSAVFDTARLPVLPLRSLSKLASELARHPDCPLVAIECADHQGRELLYLSAPTDFRGAECLPLPLRTTQVLAATRKIFYGRMGIAA